MEYLVENYPEEYRAEVAKRIGMLGNYKNTTDKDARLILQAGEMLKLDDLQIKFALLSARTKPRKPDCGIYPQMYLYFAKIVNPNEKDPNRIIEESDITYVMTNFGKPRANVNKGINAILDLSLDLKVLNGICESVKHGVRYPLELIYELM